MNYPPENIFAAAYNTRYYKNNPYYHRCRHPIVVIIHKKYPHPFRVRVFFMLFYRVFIILIWNAHAYPVN